MSTISWIKVPVIALATAALAIACSSDSNTPGPTTDGGGGSDTGAVKTCGNGKVDKNESCDPKASSQPSCDTATMGAKKTGTVSCKADCTFDLSKCTTSGTGGTGGVGGAGGTSGAGGGTPKPDAGSDASTDGSVDGSTDSGSKPDAAGTGGTAPVDSGKG